ncbi:hypothetical protein [Spirosoma litoris]
MHKLSKSILAHSPTFASSFAYVFTRLKRQYNSKLRQSMSHKQSYLFEALIVLLILLLLVLGIGWM